MPDPTPAANWYLTRRHYSTSLAVGEYDKPNTGLRGDALCDPNTDVRDQDWLDAHSVEYPHLAKRRVADLPECKKCARILARLATPEPS
jgi:hypothetical protein